MKQFYLSLLFILTAVCAKSQTFTGKVTDADNVPLPYANVVLLSLPDSTFVTGTVSGEDGSFTLQAPTDGGNRYWHAFPPSVTTPPINLARKAT